MPDDAAESSARSTLGARVSGRRAGQRFDAEYGVVTEALVFLGDLDPEAIGPAIVDATHYEPTPVGDLALLLASIPPRVDGATFVDLGAGMGRVVLLAAARPFRQVIGVEVSPALAAIARDNLARADRSRLRCRDVRIVRADAAEFRFPPGDLVVYLFNPFGPRVLSDVLRHLLADRSRSVSIVYHTAVHRTILDAEPRLEVIGETDLGVIYRSKTADAPARDPSRGASVPHDCP